MPLSPQKRPASRALKPLAQAIAVLLCMHGAQAEQLPQVTVTGNALGNSDGVQAVQALQGEELLMKSQSTLGETLSGTPGVASSYFGPNASRPIIRGMDGDRIKILNNSASSQDVSALSNDHAVPTDALAVERIEVLRGPSAIMYGGSAVGGVVNLIDNRIPSQPMSGLSGKADAGWSSGNQETRSGVLLELGQDRYALHVDAFSRNSQDQAVPDTMACEKTGAPSSAKAICNSSNSAHGHALGGSVFWDKGYLGLSANTYQSSYGTVAEDNVRIGMKSDRYALETEIRQPLAALDSLKLQLASTDYEHAEYDNAVAGTVFAQKGTELRLSGKHQKLTGDWGQVQGVWGWQAENTQFEAIGDEKFLPSTKTRQSAFYLVEELSQPWGGFSLGLRSESVQVDGDAFTPGLIPNPDRDAAASSNRFSPLSSALGVLFKLSPAWSLKGHLAQTQRAPKDYELRADGVHVATAAYEEGSTNLATEKSRQVDLGLNWAQGPHKFSMNYFVTRFDNYIGLNANGEVVDADDAATCGGVSDPENGCFTKYTFSATRPEFKGYELKTLLRLIGSKGLLQEGEDATWDLALRADAVRATNQDTGQALPRIPPVRLGATLSRWSGPWRMALGVDHANAPHLGPDQADTQAYSLWNAQFSYRQKINVNQALWYLRVDNLTDQLAYPATSVLTSTALDAVSSRPKAPLPGRSLKLGVQVDF